MDNADQLAFAALFKEAYQKCFGLALVSVITETEARIFSNKLLDQTGLSVGWKSLKNYSIFISEGDTARTENPSTATLDTLARYVLGAPYTNEIQRKNEENHFPYWFLYREKIVSKPDSAVSKRTPFMLRVFMITIALLAATFIIYFVFFTDKAPTQFMDNFQHIDDNTLTKNGWLIKSKANDFWNKRSEIPGQLTLFTLKGDSWPTPSKTPVIPDLLLHEVPYDCFTAEVHLSDFVPTEEWQQAGILLLEDTVLTGKSIRMTLAFNDNFGGRKMPSEIYVQVITSQDTGFGKPEEAAHQSLFHPDSLRIDPALRKNLLNTALRIEKQGNKFRFLYSGGEAANGAFREIATQEFNMHPKYVGIFALKGFNNAADIPVHFTFFRIAKDNCN